MAEKHLKWKIHGLVLNRFSERGAGFTEDKFIIPILKDIEEYYMSDSRESDEELEEIVREIVDYYLDKIFGATKEEQDMMSGTEGDQSTEAIVKDLDEELAGTKQDKGDKGKEDEGILGEEGRVSCRICGMRFKVLYPHLLAKHHLSPDQYRAMFPEAPLRAGVPEKEFGEEEEPGKKPKSSKIPKPNEVVKFKLPKIRKSKSATIRERIIVLANTIKKIEDGVKTHG